MMLLTTLLPLALVAHGAVVKPDHVVRQAASGTATVNLASPSGTPAHLASGLLYGIPDTANQIPSSFYTGMAFNYGRGGGSSLPAPATGWINGNATFQASFASALSNYKTARQYGARFTLILCDLWGSESTQIAMPGDNGNWTSYDNFLQAIFTNIQQYGMTPGLDLEMWNEPDIANLYWQRNESQYLQMWGRGYAKMRAAYPSVPIIGPCTSSQPSTSNTWYQQFYPFIKSNSSVPDSYCWHEETNGDDPQLDIAKHATALTAYGLPTKPIIINEYALSSEQVPGTAVWFISRLERANVQGLRGNWASDYSLHDYFAGLLGKPGASTDCSSTSCETSTGYWGNGEYGVYKYYGSNMTGNRFQTTGSSDNLFDVYATAGSTATSVKILAGSRGTAGSWNILVENLSSLGLPTSGTITIHTWHFTFADGRFGNEPPSDQGNYNHTYTNNQLVFNVGPDTTTGYAFEFVNHY